jgi:hypothetical protein
LAKELLNKYNAKYFVSESKTLWVLLPFAFRRRTSKKFLKDFKKGIDKWGGLWYNYSTKRKVGT